jgi:hypothetical protein
MCKIAPNDLWFSYFWPLLFAAVWPGRMPFAQDPRENPRSI